MNKNENVVYQNSKSLKKAVMGKKPTVPNMVRPVFYPLENGVGVHDSILFENEKMFVLECPEKNELTKGFEIAEPLKIDLIREDVLGKRDALIISLDTEYVEDKEAGIRNVLSYQISTYYNEISYRYLLFSQNEELLSLADIMVFVANEYGLKGYSYPIKKKEKVDSNGVKYKVKQYGVPLPVYILAYNELADISTLKDFPEFYSSLASSVDIVTTESWKKVCSRNSKYYFHFSVDFVGVQNHIPGGLIEVGKAVNLPKIELPEGWITKMDWVRSEQWDTYKKYAINDSDIVLEWYLDNYKGFKIPSTAPSFGADILEYVITKDCGTVKEKRAALLQWRGLQECRELTKDKYFNNFHTRKVGEEGVGIVADLIHMLASRCYSGGMNQLCGCAGFYDEFTTDFDLRGCYASFGAMLLDVDYEANAPVENWSNRILQEVDALRYPWQMWGFGTVDFRFPDTVNYPCIAIRDGNNGLVFPREGKNVDASWPEVKAAILMGAEVKANAFYIFDYKRDKNCQPTSFLHQAYSEMIEMRAECARIFGKKSAQALSCKNANNGLYGKVGQNVRAKCSRSVVYNAMDDLGPSKVTSPPHAAYFTALPRVFLCMTMQELWSKGFTCYSVTTDGFITNASLEDLQECQCFGLRDLYVNVSSKFNQLNEGEDFVWEAKHKQNYLLNVTTRVNQGYNDLLVGVEKDVTVNAHTGYKVPVDGSGIPEVARFTYDYLNRNANGVHNVTFKLPNLNDLVWGKTDYVGKMCETDLKMNFDFKRKIKNGTIKEVKMNFLGEEYTVVNFDTEPFESFQEYKKYKEICKNLKVSLISMEDYVELIFKVENNRVHKVPKLDAQVRAAVGHLRLYHRELVDKCVRQKGLEAVLSDFKACIEHSVASLYEKPTGYENKPYKADWLLKKTSWKHLPDRFNKDNYLGYAEWVENALIYLCEEIVKEDVLEG